jgi:hypothetical protein
MPTLSSEEIELEITRSKQQYLNTKERDEELRQEFKLELIKDRARSLGTSIDTQSKLIGNAFRQKKVHRRIKLTVGKGLAANFSHVAYVNDNGQTVTCDSQEAIKDACKNEGYARYMQSATTPFLQDPLVHDLGYLGDTPAGQAILEGTYDIPPAVDKYTALYLKELATPPNLPPMHTLTFTTSEFKQSWKRMRFFTSSSPFGPSFKDYIASCLDEDMATLDTALMNIPLLTRLSSTTMEASD